MFDKLLDVLPKSLQVLVLSILLIIAMTWLFAQWEHDIREELGVIQEVRTELNIRVDRLREDLGRATRDRWTCSDERRQNLREQIVICQADSDLCNKYSWPKVECPAVRLQGR